MKQHTEIPFLYLKIYENFKSNFNLVIEMYCYNLHKIILDIPFLVDVRETFELFHYTVPAYHSRMMMLVILFFTLICLTLSLKEQMTVCICYIFYNLLSGL